MLVLAAPLALAQEAEDPDAPGDPDATRATPVGERPRPGFEPEGLRLGTFVAHPSIGVEEQYNDNIFSTRKNKKNDFITEVSPGIRVESDWGIHSLAIEGNAAIGRHARHDEEDYEDIGVEVEGRYDVFREDFASGKFGFARGHEPRSSPDDAGGLRPTTFRTYALELGYFHRWTLLSMETTAAGRRIDFDDVTTLTGTVNNDDRDRFEAEGGVRFDYEIDPVVGAFVKGVYRRVHYEHKFDDAGFQRSSKGFKTDAGVKLELTGVLFGGFMRDELDDGRFKTANGLSYGTNATWTPTGTDSVSLRVQRDFRPTTIIGASAEEQTQVTLSSDHEMSPRFVISPTLFYTMVDFRGLDRMDHVIRPRIAARYHVNENLLVSAGYDYVQRVSDAANFDFTQNIARLGVDLRF